MNANTDIPQFPLCKCGCGKRVRFTSANYLPGHDAKHKGKVARQVVMTGEVERFENLPTPALRQQAKDLVDKWVAKGRAPKGPGMASIKIESIGVTKIDTEVEYHKSAKVLNEEDNTQYEVKIGRWTYPVMKHAESYLRNDRRDGSGAWGTMTEAEIAKIKEV